MSAPVLTYDEKRAVFCDWLKENGATYPKIQWPSTDTVGGCRGAMATESISSNEVMMEIPIKLMMSPMHAFQDPVVGSILHASQDLLRGDVLLTVYIMYEYLKGEASFYAPFLAILPEPGSVVQWSDSELAELQDSSITYRAKNRGKMLQVTYERNIRGLSRRHPEHFPEETYTYELFLFAWFCIQARAFGRRLPWTALVPFADCLNHANVQTKYDYDVGNNGVFRMYPTGTNSYPQGTEVFNSYGKRPNDNLLLDYGFSILDNQWDSVSLPLALPSPPERGVAADCDPSRLFTRKKRMLFHLGFHVHSQFNLQRSIFPLDALAFARLASMDERELAFAENSYEDAINKHHHYLKVQNANLELRAIKTIKQSILYCQSQWDGTSVQEDEDLLKQLRSIGEAADLISAINYRMTRKRITEAVVEKIEIIEAYLRSRVARQSMKDTVDNLTAAAATVAPAASDDNPASDDSICVFSQKTLLAPSDHSYSKQQQSPSRALWADMQRVDLLYSSNQPASGVSPYISTGSNTSFRGSKGAGAKASANASVGAGVGGLGSEGARAEMRLRSYIQAITNEALPLNMK
eukprot:GSChrysophyteH2.ASY1.ANO1.100.1 assembled CDS